MRSKHLSAKAVDLQVIENGEFVEDGWQYEAMGRYWKSLGPGHVWGGDWNNRDVYHFEVK
ncbi:MAG: M15 family metallopeptidase [Calditrichaeota bacterium]|nr:M15 family metallopeptidase [Calditrichota bacterium]